jgi:hypothetical protein
MQLRIAKDKDMNRKSAKKKKVSALRKQNS